MRCLFDYPSLEVLQCGLSWDLMMKKRGFKYLGPVTVYSHLQACGIINDHDADCPCYQKIESGWPCVSEERRGEKF